MVADRSIGGRMPCRSCSWGPSAQGQQQAHNSSHCLGMAGAGRGAHQPTLRVTPPHPGLWEGCPHPCRPGGPCSASPLLRFLPHCCFLQLPLF